MEIEFCQFFEKYRKQFQTEWQFYSSKPFSSIYREGFTWYMVKHNTFLVKESGWKLHVSAAWQNALEILDIALPILLEFKATFKFASSLDLLKEMNNGEFGPSQIGKFITIYPQNQNLIEFAKKLHSQTSQFSAPEIMTDRRCYQNSIIYYRWGRINPTCYQTPYGAIVSKIEDPQGNDIIDDSSSAFGWLTVKSTPFEGLRENLPINNNKLVNNQYLKILLLNVSASAETYLGVDTIHRRRCILKIAKNDSQADASHLLAYERLDYEAKILLILQNENFIPRLYNFIHLDEETNCLIIEDIDGKPLDSIYRSRDLFFTDSKGKLDLCIYLTKIISKIHALGIIHADIKPSNFIIKKNGEIFLIDFNSASDINQNIYIKTAGSLGFASPSRRRAEQPSILDDIYGLGAIFYYMFTEIDHEKVALEKLSNIISPHHINPEIPENLGQIILGCLERNEKNRIQSANELLAALEKINITTTTNSEKRINISQPSSKVQADPQKLYSQFIKKFFKPDVFGCGLGSNCQGDYEIVDLRGTAGCLLELLNLQVYGYKDLEPIVIHCSQFFYELESIGYNEIVGLYVGSSGIALVMIFAGYILKNKAYIDKGINKLIKLSQTNSFSWDLINGKSGLLRTILMAYVITNDKALLMLAHSIVQEFVSLCYTVNGYHCFWPSVNPASDPLNPNYLIKHRSDYAHGCGGILDALLDYYLVTNNRDILKIIQQGFDFFVNNFQIHCQTTVPNIQLKAGKNIVPLNSTYWCQGGGILKFLLRCHKLEINQLKNDFIQSWGKIILNEGRKALPIQCHGTAGNVEILIDLFQITHENQYYLMSSHLINLIDEWIMCLKNFNTPGPDFMALSWLQGIPGIISAYLRFLNHQNSQHILSLEYFQQLVINKNKNHSSIHSPYSSETTIEV